MGDSYIIRWNYTFVIFFIQQLENVVECAFHLLGGGSHIKRCCSRVYFCFLLVCHHQQLLQGHKTPVFSVFQGRLKMADSPRIFQAFNIEAPRTSAFYTEKSLNLSLSSMHTVIVGLLNPYSASCSSKSSFLIYIPSAASYREHCLIWF